MSDEVWHESRIRVRYKDTDRMGVVYYGNYLTYFEVGRSELMRDLGHPYAVLEKEGFGMVVVEAAARFLRNVGYDAMILVQTAIAEVTGATVRFDYRVMDENGSLLVSGHTLHACVNASQKPSRIPLKMREVLEKARRVQGDPPSEA